MRMASVTTSYVGEIVGCAMAQARFTNADAQTFQKAIDNEGNQPSEFLLCGTNLDSDGICDDEDDCVDLGAGLDVFPTERHHRV